MSDHESAVGAAPFRVTTIGRHSVVYGVGQVLTKAVAFVMLPVYTRWLTPADYGVLQLITMTFEVVSIIAGSRIAWGIFHHYHKAADEAGRRETLATALLLLAATYGGAAVVAVVAAPAIADVVFGAGGQYVTLIRLAATSMAFEGLIVVPIALLRLQDRSSAFVVMSLSRLGLQVALNLIFLIPLGMGLVGVLWGSVTTHAVVGLSTSAWLLKAMGVHFRPAVARALLRFGLPLVVMQVATFIVTFGDRYFLNRAGDTAQVGLYGLAYQFGFLVMALGYAPFGQVWDPQRFALAKRPDRDAIFAQVFVYLNLLLIGAALGIALFAGDILRLIAAPAFHPAAVFVPLLVAAYVLQGWGEFLNLGIYVSERTEYYTLANWIAACVAVIGYVFLIPPLLAWGATLTTVASLSVRCALTYVFSQRLWRVRYRWGPVWKMAAVAIAVGGVATVAPAMPLAYSLLFHSVLLAAYGGYLWALLAPEDRAAARLLITRRARLLGGRA